MREREGGNIVWSAGLAGACTLALTVLSATPMTGVEGIEVAEVGRAKPPVTLSGPGTLPLSFIANAGQIDPTVRFHVKGGGYSIYFTPEEVVFTAAEDAESEELRTSSRTAVVRMRFVDANPDPAIEPLEPLPGTANFFLGNDSSRWRTNVPTYAGVHYHDLYPGIDVVYRGEAGYLKSDFYVAPGADPKRIRLSYAGANALRLRQDGSLVVETEVGGLVEKAPIIYQHLDGRRVTVEGRYRLFVGEQVGFALGAYDATRPLVIDPGVVWSTFLGGPGGLGGDRGFTIEVDGSGFTYVVGQTGSLSFPITPGVFQPTKGAGSGVRAIFISKFNPAGTALVYSTYLGGRGDHEGTDLAIPPGCVSNCEVTVVGATNASNYPLKNPVQASFGGSLTGGDQVVSRLNATGSQLLFSTYLGGTAEDRGAGAAVDGANNAYVTGRSNSPNFPTTGGAYSQINLGSFDITVTKLSPSGAHLYGTYFGGASSNRPRKGLVVDAAGFVYMTGATGPAFPTTTGAFDETPNGSSDAFLVQLNPDSSGIAPDIGDLLYSTFLGGSGPDLGFEIARDPSGHVYVTGRTSSSNFPTTAGAFQTTPPNPASIEEAFVMKIDPAGSGSGDLLYSTLLGGVREDFGADVAVDAGGDIYLTGDTSSPDFPTTAAAVQLTYGGNRDIFVTRIRPGGNGLADLVDSTFFGGLLFDSGRSIALDSAGDIYLTGFTASPDFPTTLGAFSNVFNLDDDAFAAKLTLTGPGKPIVGLGVGEMFAEIDRIPPCGGSLDTGQHSGDFDITVRDAEGNVLFRIVSAEHDLDPCEDEGNGEVAPPEALPPGVLEDTFAESGGAPEASGPAATTSFPGAGVDVLDTTGEIVVDLGASMDIATVSGTIVIKRSDKDPMTHVITTEIERMVLTGWTGIMGFPVRLRVGSAFGLPVSAGTITPVDLAVGDFPATTTFDVHFEITIPRILCNDSTVLADPATCVADVTPEEIAFCLDLEGDNASLSVDPASPYGLGPSALTVECEDAGDIADSICHLLVVEDAPPTIACPPDETVTADPSCVTAIGGPLATATDNCDAEPTITSSPPVPGFLAGNGPHAIQWTAEDDFGNTAGCVQTVTVVDETPPDIFCDGAVAGGPVPIGHTFLADSDCTALQTVSASITDACDPRGALTVTNRVITPDGTIIDGTGDSVTADFPLGVTTVETTATDASGNSATCRVGVEVIPDGACIKDITDQGTCLEADVPILDGLSGEVIVGESVIRSPDSITFEILSTSCAPGDTFEIFLNGTLLASGEADPTISCDCVSPIQTVSVTDPVLLAAWNPAGNNEIRFVKSGFENGFAWVRARLETGLTTSEVCVFDFFGGNCDVEDLCVAGFDFADIDETTNIPDPILDVLPLVSEPYTDSDLPVALDLDGLPDGTYSLCVISFVPEKLACREFVKAGHTLISLNGPCQCEPDPLSQGYWHRQCLGAGLIDPGRRGRGPQEPLEPDFVKVLLPEVNGQLENQVFAFGACQAGMDADPPSDACEKALKQYTALLFNLASERLQNVCDVDLVPQGCASTGMATLVEELAELINDGVSIPDPTLCRRAADCAGAVNEGDGLVEGLALASQTASVPVGAQPLSARAVPAASGTEEGPAVEPVRAPDSTGTAAIVLAGAVEVDEPEAVEAEAEEETPADVEADEDPLDTIRRHLAVVAHASSPERARSASTDALLTALSGGYELETRIEIVKGLFSNIDNSLVSLLVEHLRDIREEARDFDREELVNEAERLLKRLEPSEE